MLEHLFKPLAIGDLELKNRVVMAPMTRARSGNNRIPGDIVKEYYLQRSSVGLIVTEGIVISDEARGWANTPGLENDGQVEAWKKITTALHEKEAIVFAQLWHTGRASHSSFHLENKLAVAPSAIKAGLPYIHTPIGKQPCEIPRALETNEIPRVVEDYRLAAERAKSAGFDGIEIHGATGYLIDTFLQSKTNLREDRYGGTKENRFRFLQEILDAVTTVFPSHKVGVKLSPNSDYNDMGSEDFKESFLHYAAKLDEYKLAYLHVVDGITVGAHAFAKESPLTLQKVREVFKGRLMGADGYNGESADKAIEKGYADLIAFGRPLLSNPDFVERLQKNWPLAETPGFEVWYAPDEKGYIDFPTYNQSLSMTAKHGSMFSKEEKETPDQKNNEVPQTQGTFNI